MPVKNKFIGIDIGSVAISLVVLNSSKQIVHTAYGFHNGRIGENLKKLFRSIDFSQVHSIAYTSSAPSIFSQGKVVDSRVAFISAAKYFHPGLRSLLIVGAEKFGLVSFDENGVYRSFKSNTSCAAGTGNFLDQQAERLNLANIQEFSKLAWENTGECPQIASRCAVFAKTDLIHVQQEGYSLSEICDGLSYGLAKNIVNTVFLNRYKKEVIAAGGVALNKAVIGHIEQITAGHITVDKYAHLYGAIGAALHSWTDEGAVVNELTCLEDFIRIEKTERKYYYPPLQLKLSTYPDFDAHEKYEFRSAFFPSKKAVEVDVYSSLKGKSELDLFLGIDIGSTSTKAVLLDRNKEVVAGFYTRTSGQPLQAVQVLFECIVNFARQRHVELSVLAAGTTGSGRKFTGQIIGADCIIDEISAHARAAYELNPATDTIIEIGGQDSKFTLMNRGVVTFSVMNNVCAAGTGSFIEEQAKRLGCSLFDYADRVEKVQSPMASDRCTVFMERDLNHYLMAGYSTDEILAAVLHSTRENYLTKVAKQGQIGETIFFQGATAKNKALVAAFEQKLKKPILVSRYCHLTGALGVALDLFDKDLKDSTFKGLDLYHKSIPMRSEVCQLCTNHCKIKVAEVDDRIEAYGFLCGRDYGENKYVKNKNAAFQLIRKRNRLFSVKPKTKQSALTIGIPAGLHLYEELSFWQKFFDLLSIRTITSEAYASPVKDGKNLTGAEFCAPIAALHGHVNYLKDKADYIFLPTYLEEHQAGEKSKQYCYYTQFVTSVISVQKNIIGHEKLLIPLLKSAQGELFNRLELFRMLKKTGISNLNFVKLTLAYETAKKEHQAAREKWRTLYQNEIKANDDIHIMLLGRPYTVLSQAMNNHIPTIFEKMGVKTFFMDMLPGDTRPITKSEDLIKAMKWKFASKILQATEVVAQTPDCYPVLITSFKCTPDSFVMEYFKDILDAGNKPYLILQLDEHDSAVGYETRIEAGIRAFRNHRERREQENTKTIEANKEMPKAVVPVSNRVWNDPVKSLVNEASRILQSHGIDFKLFSKSIQQMEVRETQLSNPIITGAKNMKGKTLLLPSYDLYSGPLLEAVLQNSGIDARITESSSDSAQRSLSFNTGQCIPLNIIVQDAIDYMEKNKLNPADTLLWIMQTELTCNLSMFPYFMQKLLNNYGQGMEQASVYVGHMIFYDFSLPTAINAYVAHMFSGYIRRISCGIRPYEKHAGATEAVIQKSLKQLYNVFRNGEPKEQVLEQIINDFEAIETIKTDRPKVAIFGDLYVRDNDLMNQNLIKTIEANGGEVITTPYSEYMKIIAEPMTERFFKEGFYRKYLLTKFLTSLIPLVEGKYRKYLDGFMGTENPISSAETDTWLSEFGLNIFQRGESIENILKIHHLIKQYPDLDLFIQTNPSYCCPSLVTEAMKSKIEELTGVPVLTIEYDGTAGFKNQDLIPYLKYRKRRN